jgi:hypothetical protein
MTCHGASSPFPAAMACRCGNACRTSGTRFWRRSTVRLALVRPGATAPQLQSADSRPSRPRLGTGRFHPTEPSAFGGAMAGLGQEEPFRMRSRVTEKGGMRTFTEQAILLANRSFHRVASFARWASQSARCFSPGKTLNLSLATQIGALAFCRDARNLSASCDRSKNGG